MYHSVLATPMATPSLVYKYNILERVIVENIIPRNVIINRDAVEVDNHISRDDFFDYHPLKNVIFILLYRTLFLNFSTFFPLTMQWCGKVQVQQSEHLLRMDAIISFTKGLCL